MPSLIRDVVLRNIIVSDELVQELNAAILKRIEAHNESTQTNTRRLEPIYIVRFDTRGFRTFSSQEAWCHYTTAKTVERIVLLAECPDGIGSNRQSGEYIEVRLDSDSKGNSHLVVGGDSKDWVEATFTILEGLINRRKSGLTAVIRTQWTALLLQLIGVAIGMVLCLWLATLIAPNLKNVEYPRALSFALCFLLYSNLWSYLFQQSLSVLGALFPNVRFSRKGDHWIQTAVRKGIEASCIAVALWVIGWLLTWATSLLAPFLNVVG